MNEQEFAELAAGHALNALSEADERRYAEALGTHPEWVRIARSDAETVAFLADTVTPQTPPPALLDGLLARVAVTPQGDSDATRVSAGPETTSDSARPSVPRRPWRMLFALAACLVLLVGIGSGAAVLISQLQRPASVVALEQIENAPDAQEATVDIGEGGSATAHWSASVGNAVLVTDGLKPLDDDQTYELWYVRADAPVSAGVFQADSETTTALLEGEMQAGDAIAVTIEPAGGSPTGAPTSDPVIVIPTA